MQITPARPCAILVATAGIYSGDYADPARARACSSGRGGADNANGFISKMNALLDER